jgi:hypothetical protein
MPGLPDHFGAHCRRIAENLTPKIIMKVPFCQYSHTLMHPIGHAAPRQSLFDSRIATKQLSLD